MITVTMTKKVTIMMVMKGDDSFNAKYFVLHLVQEGWIVKECNNMVQYLFIVTFIRLTRIDTLCLLLTGLLTYL